MTRDEAKAAAQVLLAYADGQSVEVRSKESLTHALGGWRDEPNPSFNFHMAEYRIKPKPREWWILMQGSGRVWGTFNTLEEAQIESHGTRAIIKVREVIE